MCAFGVELTLPVHRRARQDPYAGGTTGRRAAGAHPGDPWGVPRADPTGRVGVGKGLNVKRASGTSFFRICNFVCGYANLIL